MNIAPDTDGAVRVVKAMEQAVDEHDITNAALFFLTDEAKYVTGAIVDVSGGWATPWRALNLAEKPPFEHFDRHRSRIG